MNGAQTIDALNTFQRVAQVDANAAIGIVRGLMGQQPVSEDASRFRSLLAPELWRRLHAVANTATSHELLQTVDLVRAVLSQDSNVRQMIRSFAQHWHPDSRKHLMAVLTGFSVADGALYLSSYKPRGRVVTPPFGLAAECLLEAHGYTPQPDSSLLANTTGEL